MIGYVVIEWNQASGQPSAVGDLYDTIEYARDEAAGMQAATDKVGRRERFTVHEVGDAEGEDA